MTLLPGVVELRVHRSALASHSLPLRRMLTSGMREAVSGRLELADSSPAAVAAMLRFFTTGTFPDSAPMTELLVLCERYQATAALEACAALVKECIDVVGRCSLTGSNPVLRAPYGFSA